MSDFRFSYSWKTTPLQILATFIWNNCERFNIKCPFAPIIFSLIMGKKGERINKESEAGDERN